MKKDTSAAKRAGIAGLRFLRDTSLKHDLTIKMILGATSGMQ